MRSCRRLSPADCTTVTIIAEPRNPLTEVTLSNLHFKNRVTHFEPAYAKVHKISTTCLCPFPQTLFLDVDIVILNATRLFRGFGTMGEAAISARRDFDNNETNLGAETTLVPSSFPEMNSGIIFMQCPQARPIMTAWLENYMSGKIALLGEGDSASQVAIPQIRDQMSFRVTLYQHRDQYKELERPLAFGCKAVGDTFKHLGKHFPAHCNTGHYSGRGHDKERKYSNLSVADFQ